jgi:hypothetical protein
MFFEPGRQGLCGSIREQFNGSASFQVNLLIVTYLLSFKKAKSSTPITLGTGKERVFTPWSLRSSQ